MYAFRRLALCASGAFVLASGCKPKGDGELRGVRYHLELQGSYSMVQRSEREQVWIPSDDDRPFVSVQVRPRPRPADGGALPCPPGQDGGKGTSYGGFYFVRKGDSVDMKTAQPPHGVTVSTNFCLPPGEESISCSANFADGEMPADRETQARAVCKSLVVR